MPMILLTEAHQLVGMSETLKGGNDMSKLLRNKLEKLADPTYPRRLEEFQQKINPKPPKEEIEAELQRRRLHLAALMAGKVTETAKEVNK